MILYVLVGLAVLVCIYFYMQNNIEEHMENYQREPFVPSDSFIGAKEGYVFKNDFNGLGYYLDKLKI
jgi:hypothetical protein